MIIKQLFCFILFFYWFIAYGYLLLTPALLTGVKPVIKEIKVLSQTLSTMLLINSFDIEFYIGQTEKNVEYLMNQNTDLIDIIVCNHFSSLDFLIVLSYLQKFNIFDFNFALKHDLIYLPGFGLAIYASDDVKLKRNWDKDKQVIGKQLDNIKTGYQKQVFIIFAEGTRINETKLRDAQRYSLENNLPVFNNLLVPKTKGLWYIVNHLKETNRLGRIWDMTLVMPKYLGSSAYTSDIFGKSIGPVYGFYRELDLTNVDYQDMNNFKSWFLKNWKIKDDYLQNYKKFIYKKIVWDDHKYKEKFVIFLVIFMNSLLLSKKYGRYYLIISFILSYMIMLKK